VTPLVEELTPVPDPVRSCERLEGLPYRLFLDSAASATRLGRYSFLTADPIAVIQSTGAGDALDAVRARLAPHTADPVPGLPPFQGGVAGYIGYDWGLSLERLPAPRVLAWDHVVSRAWLISTGMPETAESARMTRARERASAVQAQLENPARSHPSAFAASRLRRDKRTFAPSHPRTLAPSHPVENGWWDPSVEIRSSFTRAGYLEAVQRVREYIFAGDIFQANLSQRFEASLSESPWAFYTRLRSRNAAPFAAFFETPEVDVISASPERFLRVDRNGFVETRPIKGTRPRGVGPEHDAALGQALAESAKDRAENLMIVDLMRNDLSRVCAPRTVRVSELFSLERYATVHHLVSTVVGQLEPGHDALHLLRAAFPGGSITGAPKLRAMEIIAELEPSRRGVYCGAIGYWSITGELDTAIAIRTAVVRDGRIYFSAGGGIVADSDPVQEYAETLDKARATINTLTSR
jgi:para-aminobenzoate synthetase component I